MRTKSNAHDLPGLTWRFVRDERGGTAIEYSLIAGFIFMAIVTAVGLIGTGLVTQMTPAVNGLK
jgi:pilus assembly protein Flp/PilA